MLRNRFLLKYNNNIIFGDIFQEIFYSHHHRLLFYCDSDSSNGMLHMMMIMMMRRRRRMTNLFCWTPDIEYHSHRFEHNDLVFHLKGKIRYYIKKVTNSADYPVVAIYYQFAYSLMLMILLMILLLNLVLVILLG